MHEVHLLFIHKSYHNRRSQGEIDYAMPSTPKVLHIIAQGKQNASVTSVCAALGPGWRNQCTLKGNAVKHLRQAENTRKLVIKQRRYRR